MKYNLGKSVNLTSSLAISLSTNLQGNLQGNLTRSVQSRIWVSLWTNPDSSQRVGGSLWVSLGTVSRDIRRRLVKEAI